MKKLIRILPVVFLTFLSACQETSCDCSPTASPLKPTIVSPVDGKEMVLVPAGEFIMGTNRTDPEQTHQKIGAVKPLYLDQQPEQKIFLDNFYIDKYEVTNKEYKRFIKATLHNELPAHWMNGSYPEGLGNHPVTNIAWREALAYALWAGKLLPTEVQWEKANRGNDGREFPWGNKYEKGFGNIGLDGAKKTMPVGSYPKDVSPYQVYDMGGNVMEWTLDWYLSYPNSNYKSKRFGKKFKVMRGNGFQNAGHYFLEAYRYSFHRTEADPDEYFENVGFRCVSLVPKG